MTYTNPSMRQTQSKRTLAMALVLFVCQIFVNCVWASVEVTDNDNAFGLFIVHSHAHASDHGHDRDADHNPPPKQCDCCSCSELISPSEDANHEHEHTNHSHVTCHPPKDSLVDAILLAGDRVAPEIQPLLKRTYAPLIPPPDTQRHS